MIDIVLPHNGQVVQPARVIVLEEPFGRERTEVADLIDVVVCIDLPLAMALARKLLRMQGFFLAEQTVDAFIQHLNFFLPWYIESGYELYNMVQQRVLQGCNIIADGMLPPDKVADSIAAALGTSFPELLRR